MTRRRPYVTEHALLRYLERVVGIDTEAHRREIETATAQAVRVGACGLIKDGWRYAIEDFRIVTVHPASAEPRYPHHAFTGSDE